MGLRDELSNAAAKAGETLKQKVSERLADGRIGELKDKLSGAMPVRPEKDTVMLEGRVPNPLGTGELLNVSVAITTVEDAGGERTRLRAKVQTPMLQRVAPNHAPRLEYTPPKSGLPALINQLPGGERVVRRVDAIRSELGARLPVVEPTGDEVTTVFDIDMNRRKPVLADGESRGLVSRAKERFALMAGPENWQVDQQEVVTDEGFRGLMTIRSGDDSPVDVVAKVGVELKKNA